MKIVYLYDNLPSYRRDFFNLLSKKFEEEGHVFTLMYGINDFGSKQDKKTDYPSVPMVTKNIKVPMFNMCFYENFLRKLDEEKPDVIVLQFHVAFFSYWQMYFYCKRRGIPFCIWDCHYTRDTLGSFAVKIRHAAVDFTFKKATACIAYGTWFRDYLLKLGRKPEEVFVAQNTINIESLLEKRNPACANKIFGNEIRILYVGMISKRKYLNEGIQAVTNVIKKGYNVYFDVVGPGEGLDEMKAKIKQDGVEDRILIHGPKYGEELQHFWECSDLFILPGTGGLAINEAMAYSLPVISTIGDGTAIDLIDGNGYLLNNLGNVAELESAIEKFMNLTAEEKAAMSRRSEQLIRECALLSNMVYQHIKAVNYAYTKSRRKR